MFSSLRAAEPAPTSSTPKAGPKFPVYLLPSFTMPFRRPRQSCVSVSGSRPPHETTVPTLSSSPTDSTISSPVGSPTSPSFFSSRFSFSQARNIDNAGRRTSVDPLSSPLATGISTTTTLPPRKLSRTQPDTIRCSTCSADFAFCSQIVSKGFTGRYGRAYLIAAPEHPRDGPDAGNLINVRVGKSETRLLVTGSHVVADITCAICQARVGWKYVDAKEESQKYKVGKFILETQRVVDYRSWEDVPALGFGFPGIDDFALDYDRKSDHREGAADDDDPIVFDSEDEDECEDLFSGSWDPEVAAKRRARKVNRQTKPTATAAV